VRELAGLAREHERCGGLQVDCHVGEPLQLPGRLFQVCDTAVHDLEGQVREGRCRSGYVVGANGSLGTWPWARPVVATILPPSC